VSALLNWLKMVFEPFGQSNMQRTLKTSQEGMKNTTAKE
jgi:hypothetical protein